MKSEYEIIEMGIMQMDYEYEHSHWDMEYSYDHWIIDLQGAELLALKGAENSLKHCKSMSIEVSTVDIYQGGVLWAELKEWLNKHNFYQSNKPNNIHTDILFKKNIKTKEVI